MPDPYATLSDLLDQLTAELRRLELWSEQPPAPEALASSAPFCYDTLAFEQWLQWVFIPQLRHMIALQAPLPASCAISPMGELAFAESDWDAAPLIALLQTIDASFTEAAGPAQ
jgi:uncharacterized protein YqcC (DUF446 family)